MAPHQHHQTNEDMSLADPGMVLDPVCGMSLDPALSEFTVERDGHRYDFCSKRCMLAFESNPQEPLPRKVSLSMSGLKVEGEPPSPSCCHGGGSATVTAQTVPAPEGAEFTCPMHPEIVQDQPGSCPICGMALEARGVPVGDEDDTELTGMNRRFRVSLLLSIPVFVLAMGELIPGIDLLRLAASLEKNSEHPLAAAIIDGAHERGITLSPVDSFESITGQGIIGKVEGLSVAVGNRALVDDRAALSESIPAVAEELRSEGQTVMFVAVDGVVSGILGVMDPIKETTAEAIDALHAEGLTIVMLTGDSRTTAEAIGGKLHIDDIVAEVMPDEKAAAVSKLQNEDRVVAMAGDGINDAPALAQADVGIAMGTGTDVAMESAGVTLIKGDLRGIVRARALSRATMANIKQNLFFAFAYNAVGIPIAAGLLYPFSGLLLSPMLAAAAMSFSSVSVIANALRLRRQAI